MACVDGSAPRNCPFCYKLQYLGFISESDLVLITAVYPLESCLAMLQLKKERVTAGGSTASGPLHDLLFVLVPTYLPVYWGT